MGRPLPGHSSSEDQQVVLGMPGAWADEMNEFANHFTTKIGGHPDWPVPLEPLIKSDQLKCAVCDGFLCLVAQVHSPLTSDGLNYPERTLYILGCPTQGCGTSQTSWRTIRVQKNTFENTPPEQENGADRIESNHSSGSGGTDPADFEWRGTSSRHDEADTPQRDDWWDGNPWDEMPAEGPTDDEVDTMNLQELQSSLMEATRLAATVSGAQNSSDTDRRTGVQRNAGTVVQSGPNHNLPVVPCFYIYTQAESSTRGGPSAPGTNAQGGLQALGENEDPSSGGEEAGESWESEEYEPDQALYADRTYLKFKKKLDYHPEQCFRYSFTGEPLYAIDEQRDPTNCAACGGPRVFEMQLMPPLLYYLQQAHRDLPPSTCGPEDWDWHTLLVFSCAQSCIQEESQQLLVLGEKTEWSFIEEATVIQQDLNVAYVR